MQQRQRLILSRCAAMLYEYGEAEQSIEVCHHALSTDTKVAPFWLLLAKAQHKLQKFADMLISLKKLRRKSRRILRNNQS